MAQNTLLTRQWPSMHNVCTLWGVHLVTMLCFVFFWKFHQSIWLHSSYSISPTASETCKKYSTGVCCVKSYVSKSKKHGYVLEGWYIYMIFHVVIFLQNLPTPKNRTHVSYVSKRNFLRNTPQYITTEWTPCNVLPLGACCKKRSVSIRTKE